MKCTAIARCDRRAVADLDKIQGRAGVTSFLMAQRLDGIQPRGLAGRNAAEGDAKPMSTIGAMKMNGTCNTPASEAEPITNRLPEIGMSLPRVEANA